MEEEKKIIEEIPKEKKEEEKEETIEDITKNISKRKQKREKQRQHWDSIVPELRKQKKLRQKKRLKEKIEIMNEKAEKGDEEAEEFFQQMREKSKYKGRQFKEEFRKKLETSTPLIIDCDFEDTHIPKDLRSLVNQFSQMLGKNKKFENPFQLHLTGIGPKTIDILKTRQSDGWLLEKSSKDFFEIFPNRKEDFIYLTGDAKEEMTEFDSR